MGMFIMIVALCMFAEGDISFIAFIFMVGLGALID